MWTDSPWLSTATLTGIPVAGDDIAIARTVVNLKRLRHPRRRLARANHKQASFGLLRQVIGKHFHRVGLGDRGLEKGSVEYKGRRDSESRDIALDDLAAFLKDTIRL